MRDLASEIQSKVQKGLKKLGTVLIESTYKQMDTPVYNTDTGGSTQSVIETFQLDVVFSEFTFTSTRARDEFEDEEGFRSIDRWLIFAQLDLPITPSINDIVVDDKGINWRIMGIGGDPADAHYSLHGRPINE